MTPLPIATTGPEQAMMNQTKKILEEHSQEQYDPDVSRSTFVGEADLPERAHMFDDPSTLFVSHPSGVLSR